MKIDFKRAIFILSLIFIPIYIFYILPLIYNIIAILLPNIETFFLRYILMLLAQSIPILLICIIITLWSSYYTIKETFITCILTIILIIIYVAMNIIALYGIFEFNSFTTNQFNKYDHLTWAIRLFYFYIMLLCYLIFHKIISNRVTSRTSRTPIYKKGQAS